MSEESKNTRILFKCYKGHTLFIQGLDLYTEGIGCTSCSSVCEKLKYFFTIIPRSAIGIKKEVTETQQSTPSPEGLILTSLSSVSKQGTFQNGSLSTVNIEEDPDTDDPLEEPFDYVDISLRYKIMREK